MIPLPARRPAIPLAWAAVAVAGCTTLEGGDLREATAMPIAPYESLEECMRLAPGDRLDYAFSADAPVKFDIRYREAGATLIPIGRDAVESESGIYRAVLAQDYCATWESGVRGAILTYRLRRIPGAP